MEVDHEEYDDQRTEELKEKYLNYDDMDIETLDSELTYLDKDLKESETNEEMVDIQKEFAYVNELKRRRLLQQYLTREQLAKRYPDLSKLSDDELLDRGNKLLNEMILSNLDEDSFKEKSEELRYIRMPSGDYQRESSLNELLNLRDKVKRRKLIKRDDNRKLELFKIWARENAGTLSAVLISTTTVIVGLIAATRNILWKVSDSTRKLDKRISKMEGGQIRLPPVFQKIADVVESAADNIWIVVACAIVGLLYAYS